MSTLTPSDALRVRIASLLLTGWRPASLGADDARGVVTWMGAMQAQDYASMAWSLGSRLRGSTLADVEAALDAGDVLRTWPMRGTVHLVPARDAAWMVELLGARVLKGAAARRASLGLADGDAERACEVLDGLLAGRRLTRAECMDALVAAGLPVERNLGYHLLWYSSQRGITCLGPNLGKEQTFERLADRVPEPHRPTRDEALATIARRFVRSHGPVTAHDLARWIGATVGDARAGLADAGDSVVSVTPEGRQAYVSAEALAAVSGGDPRTEVPGWLWLAGFDEYMLGFKDRALIMAPEHLDAVVPGSNGVFRSTLVRDGRVVGTWTRTITARAVKVAVHRLVRLTARERAAAESAIGAYAGFLGREPKVTWD